MDRSSTASPATRSVSSFSSSAASPAAQAVAAGANRNNLMPTAAMAAILGTSSGGGGAGTAAGSSNGGPSPSSSRAHSLAQSVNALHAQPTFSAGEAAKHLGQEHVARKSQDMFRKISDYVRGELLAAGEDYRLLENMNNLTRERYGDMAGVAQELMVQVGTLRTTYSDFEPYLAKIDDISQQAETMSKIAQELDQYSQELELRLKTVLR